MSFYTKLEELIPNDEELRNKIWEAYDEVRSEDRREQENDKLRERVRDLEKQLSTVVKKSYGIGDGEDELSEDEADMIIATCL